MDLRAAAQAPSPGARQGDACCRVSRMGEGSRSGRAAAHFPRTMSRHGDRRPGWDSSLDPAHLRSSLLKKGKHVHPVRLRDGA